MTRTYHERIAALIEDFYRAAGRGGQTLQHDIADILENAYDTGTGNAYEEVEDITRCGAGEPRTR